MFLVKRVYLCAGHPLLLSARIAYSNSPFYRRKVDIILLRNSYLNRLLDLDQPTNVLSLFLFARTIDVFRCSIHLPPTLNSFDVFGSLLRDKAPMTLGTTGAPITVGEAVESETPGYFLHECISWLDKAELEERERLVSEDIFAKACKTYEPLLPDLQCR